MLGIWNEPKLLVCAAAEPAVAAELVSNASQSSVQCSEWASLEARENRNQKDCLYALCVWSLSDNKSALSRLGQKVLSYNSFVKALLLTVSLTAVKRLLLTNIKYISWQLFQDIFLM